MARFISAAVGAGSLNLPEDVRVVQTLLNQVPPGAGEPVHPLNPDGLVGPLTITAINKFQKRHFGFQDGKVDTDKVTLHKLNEFDRTPAATAPVSFRHESPLDPLNPQNISDPLDGFDPAATPFPWLLVGRLGTNRVRLVNGGSFSLLTSNPKVATVERVFTALGHIFLGIIAVHGTGAGDASIQVVDGVRNQVGRLDVTVTERRPVSIALHFVDNPDWGTQKRDVDEASQLLDTLNRLYDRQTNVHFVSLGNRKIKLTENLGDSVQSTEGDADDEFPLVVRHRNPGAKVNVFFVRAVTNKFGSVIEAVTEHVARRDSVIGDDNAEEFAELVAHEVGHALGATDDPDGTHLMFEFSDERRGRKITKEIALSMNRNALHLP